MNSLMKSIFIGLIFSFISVYAKETKYPDVWYRLYDWPTNVCDMFYSDTEMWGNEPVVILCKGDRYSSDFAIAEGFFSKKRRPISIIKNKKGINGILYVDQKTKKVMNQNFQYDPRIPILNYNQNIFLPQGILFLTKKDILFSWSSYTNHEIVSKDIADETPIITDVVCEPLVYSVQFMNHEQEIIWNKSFVRIYQMGTNLPPKIDTDKCSYYPLLVTDGGASIFLVLSDGTMLISGYPFTYIVRIRIEDGSSKNLPPNLKIIDTKEIIKYKLKVVEEYLAEYKKKFESIYILSDPDKIMTDIANFISNEPKGKNTK